MLTAEIIERRLHTFWGYGSLQAPTWFVGMEEGGGEDLAERFAVTDGHRMVDIRNGMKGMTGHLEFYTGDNPKIQSTLAYPIRLFLCLKNGRPPSREDVRHFQRYNFGDVENCKSASLELSSLPARSTSAKDWKFGSRQEYLDKHLPRRTTELSNMVAEHEPRVVIFYSTGYMKYWLEVIGSTKVEEVEKQMYYAHRDGTHFFIIPQNHHGMTHIRIHDFAKQILSKVDLSGLAD